MQDANHSYVTPTLREMDGLPCSHPASVSCEVAEFYFQLTRLIRPKLVVEIGCFIGFSSLHIAQALHAQGFGHMLAIDAFDWEVDAGRGLENREIIARRYLDQSGLKDRLEYIKGYSTQVYPALQARIHQAVDLLFIDGDHSIPGVLADFNTYVHDVRPGGMLVLHDIYPTMCGCDGPRALIDALEYSGDIPRHLDKTELMTADGFGVALLRRKTAAPIGSGLRARAGWHWVREKLARKNAPAMMPKSWMHAGVPLQVVIQDATTHAPIGGARLVCPQRYDETHQADSFGCIHLTHWLPNQYLVDVSAPGYQPMANVMLDVSMEPERNQFEFALQRSSS